MNTRSARFFAIAAVATLVAGGGALAQVKFVELADGTKIAPWNMTVDGVKKLNVLAAGGKTIGEVEEVIGTGPSDPTAVVVDFEDGVGFGERENVAIALDKFQMTKDGLVLTASADDVANMPRWND